MARRLTRGEIRLCRFEAPDRERPVVILTRDSAIPLLTRVTVAPITTSIRGVPSEVRLGVEDGMKTDSVVNLHNIVTIASDRLGPRLASLSSGRMREICDAMAYALCCGE